MHTTLGCVDTWGRRVLAFILLVSASFWTASDAAAQYAYPIDHSQVVHSNGMIISPGPPPEKVCRLRPQEHTAQTGGTIRALQQAPQDLSSAGAEFEVTYQDACSGEVWPEEAEEAFERALDTWSTHIESAVPIRVEALWAELGGEEDDSQTLGSAGPTRVVRFEQDDLSIGMRADTWYPVAAASALSGQDIVGEQIEDEDYDVVVNMNCEYDNWHFEDSEPSNSEIDFSTIVLHEIGHGLGFLGLMEVPVDEDQNVEEEIATWGLEPAEGEDPLPAVYDRFAEDGEDRSLLNEDVYPNPSEDLYEALTGEHGGVFFDGASANAAEDDGSPELYAPGEWQAGSSYSHLDQEQYEGTLNALMRPIAGIGRIETPGPITCGIMSDIGWPVGSDCRSFFEPALADLNARVENSAVELTWESTEGVEAYNVEYLSLNEPGQESFTLAETNVEAPFEITFNDLTPGEYVFRVSPSDARVRSDEVLAFVGVEDPVFVRGPYPNPFTDQAEVLFVVDEEQHIELTVYDAAGRRVAVLYDERAEANEVYQRRLDDGSLSSGVYLFHFVGETFEQTESAVLVR